MLLVILLVAPCPAEEALPPVTLFHTNDWHGTLQPAPALWMGVDDPPTVGGAALLGGLLDRLRLEVLRSGGRYLVVDAGDRFQGDPVVNLSRGRLMTDLYNQLGYTVVALGNHDFDHDLQGLVDSQETARFPLVCANLHPASGTRGVWRPSVVAQVGRVRIGILGAMTEDLPLITFPRNIAGTLIEPVIPALRREVARLRERGCGIIVLLSHCGHPVDLLLAVAVPGLDVIVGGHTQNHLEQPRHLNGVWIVQTRGFGSHLGQMTLFPGPEGKGIDKVEYRSHLLDVARVSPDPVVEALIASASAPLRAELARTVGTLPRPLLRSGPAEDSLPAAVARAVGRAVGVPLAVFHTGGARADLPAGPVTFGQVYNALPFNHSVLVGELSGRDLEAAWRRGVALNALAWTGLKSPPGGTGLQLGDGTTVVPDGRYRVAYNNFLAQGGDGFGEFSRAANATGTEALVRDAFLESLATNRP